MKLSDYLRHVKDMIVRKETVLVENWSPTYGEQDPSGITIDVIDFDALLNAIDEFEKEFKN